MLVHLFKKLSGLLLLLLAFSFPSFSVFGESVWPRKWQNIRRVHGGFQMNLISLDAQRSLLYIFPSGKTSRNILLMLPDYGSHSFSALFGIIDFFRKENHVAVLLPRTSLKRDTLGRIQDPKELTKNYLSASRYLFDFQSAISALKENQTALHIEYDTLGLLLGDYYSNLGLIQKISGVDCMVLLSPNRSFYEQKTVKEDLKKALSLPILMFSNHSGKIHLRDLKKDLTQAQIYSEKGVGRGFHILLRRPSFVKRISSFLKNECKSPYESSTYFN